MKKGYLIMICIVCIFILLFGCVNHFEDDRDLKCRISIDCTTILDNMDNLDPDKYEMVPEDGFILSPCEVSFTEGESLYDVLMNVTMEYGIHVESNFTPVYNSAYIEGIGNLYEFDCGELSGWTYIVNGEALNKGCSSYEVKAGDIIEWRYTCNLGRDIGIEWVE
ncbi:MAG: DUF4430 domain-containing protein [Clostridia bacterium]|nr:DUF4430 domain-containing protein [Clostridia bacterium]